MQLARRNRFFGLLALVMTFAMMGYGFTAQLDLPATNAGFGSGEIEGYTVTNVRYTPFNGFPDLTSGVTFDLDKPARTVQTVFPTEPGGDGIVRQCEHFPTSARPYRWGCSVLATIESLEWLEVAAAQ